MKRSLGNVFEDLGFESDEAAHLLLRADLMIAVLEYIKENKLLQKEAAVVLGVTQPEISYMQNGKIQHFSLDKLVLMLSRIGKKVELRVRPE